MARFAWQRLTGAAGFVQWKVLTASGFAQRKPGGRGGIRPAEIAGHVEICSVEAPEGVARFTRHA